MDNLLCNMLEGATGLDIPRLDGEFVQGGWLVERNVISLKIKVFRLR